MQGFPGATHRAPTLCTASRYRQATAYLRRGFAADLSAAGKGGGRQGQGGKRRVWQCVQQEGEFLYLPEVR